MNARFVRTATAAGVAVALAGTGAAVVLAIRDDGTPVAAPSPLPVVVTMPSPTPTPTPSPSPSCPPIVETRPSLPFGVPGDLPWPSGAIVEGVDRDGRDVVVRMRVRRPIADLIAYAQAKLAEEGYEVKGGTIGGELSNLPFVRGSIRGGIELRLAGPCDTRFAVTVGV